MRRAFTPLHFVDWVQQRLLGVARRELTQWRQRFVSNNVTGFTLVELVIVIAIVGILAAIAIPRFIDIRAEAYRSQRDGIIGSIRAGILTVAAQNQVNQKAGTFPPNLEALWNGIPGGTLEAAAAVCGTAAPTSSCFELVIPGGYTDPNWKQNDATGTVYKFTDPVAAGDSQTCTYSTTNGTLTCI